MIGVKYQYKSRQYNFIDKGGAIYGNYRQNGSDAAQDG